MSRKQRLKDMVLERPAPTEKPTSALAVPEEPELSITLSGGKMGNAAMFVRWCANKALFARLAQKGVEDPHVLVVIWNPKDEHRERRFLFPMKDVMGYVAFPRPGEWRVLACIVWDKDNTGPNRTLWLSKTSGTYDTDLIDYREGKLLSRLSTLGSVQTDVEVDEKFFAKRPRPWVWWWANLFFDDRHDKPEDDCNMRRRYIWAFTIQPWLVLVWCIFILALRLVLVAALLSLFVRPSRVQWKVLWNPLSLKTEDLLEEKLSSYDFLWGKEWRGYELRPLLHLTPGWLLCLTSIVIRGPGMDWPTALRFVLVLSMVLILVRTLLAIAGREIGRREIAKAMREVSQPPPPPLPTPRWYEMADKVQVVLRDPKAPPAPALVSALPKPQQTLSLRFLDLKQRLCKPFAT